MMQTMQVADVAPLQNKDEINRWENRPFSGVWAEKNNRRTDITRNRIIKKKCKRVRTAFTTDQLRALEKTYFLNKYINTENRQELSRELNIGEKCIKIWFQNRRMKEKRASSESCDSSSETVSTEVMSPLVTQTESIAVNIEQTVYNQPCTYYQPPTYQMYDVKTQAQVYVPNNNFIPNNDYSLMFSETNNLCPAQYYGEKDNAYVYQNQNQFGNEMYNWCPNDVGLYNFF